MTPEHSDLPGSPDEPVPPPWYHEGLPFSCTQCGNCCTGHPGYVWVSDEESRLIADHLGISVGEFRLLHTHPARGRVSLNEYANGDCVFLDSQSRRCTIYPVRPIQCRTWPFWRSNVSTREAWERTQQVCPGCREGELVSLEGIAVQLDQTDL